MTLLEVGAMMMSSGGFLLMLNHLAKLEGGCSGDIRRAMVVVGIVNATMGGAFMAGYFLLR